MSRQSDVVVVIIIPASAEVLCTAGFAPDPGADPPVDPTTVTTPPPPPLPPPPPEAVGVGEGLPGFPETCDALVVTSLAADDVTAAVVARLGFGGRGGDDEVLKTPEPSEVVNATDAAVVPISVEPTTTGAEGGKGLMLPPADEELKDVAPAPPEPEDAEEDGPAAVLGAPVTP